MTEISEDKFYEILDAFESVKEVKSCSIGKEEARTVWFIPGLGDLVAECKGLPRRGRDAFLKDGKNWKYFKEAKVLI